jgi:hydrogenase nickel incorporation protein HypA/HybF
MHEKGITENLVKKILELALKEHATKVSKITVTLGAFSHMSPSHFKDHFDIAARGTIAENAIIEAEESKDIHDKNASIVVLKSIDVE